MKYYKLDEYSSVTVVEIPFQEIKKIDVALCEQPRQTLKAFYDDQTTKPDVIVNGGFFSMSNGNTVFDLVDEGAVISDESFDFDGIGIIGDKELIFAKMSSRTDWRDFVSAYPALISDGKKCSITQASEINYNARRSILAYDDTNLYIIAVEGSGMNFAKMQNMLLGMNVKYAINLDGGGSTKILYEGKSITSTAYNRAVDSVVAVYRQEVEPTPATLYRVQVGAFGKYSNAVSMQEQIRDLTDDIGAGYKNAYIKKVGNLYKVQVGAFSKRENAVKVSIDLASKGFDSFITTNS